MVPKDTPPEKLAAMGLKQQRAHEFMYQALVSAMHGDPVEVRYPPFGRRDGQTAAVATFAAACALALPHTINIRVYGKRAAGVMIDNITELIWSAGGRVGRQGNTIYVTNSSQMSSMVHCFEYGRSEDWPLGPIKIDDAFPNLVNILYEDHSRPGGISASFSASDADPANELADALQATM
jgi:hypothetical protein